MASVQIGFYLICLFFGAIAHTNHLKLPSSVHQETRFISAKSGDRVTLQCTYEGTAWFYWYKQTLGGKPTLISTFYNSDKKFIQFEDAFNKSRFRLDTEKRKHHLIISDLRISDTATYHCIRSYFYKPTFSQTIFVSVNDLDLNIQALVQQSASETIQPGGSVTLNCTVHTGPCDGEHSVYWFKRSSESHSGLIYTRGGRNDQCERKPNTQTHTCIYNLPMNNLNVSHVGTYYCAVASCEHILFGNGTKLDFKDDVSTFWSSAFAFSSILSALLTFSVCMMSKKCDCKSSESQASPTKADAKGFPEAETMFALNVNMRLRGQRAHTWSECVYSRVKQ